MQSEAIKLDPAKILIVDFKIIEGHINSPFDFSKEEVKGHDFNVEFKLGFNLDEQLVKADFRVDITTKSEGSNAEEATGLFHFVFVFTIENLKELAIPQSEFEVELDGGLANALSSITYSTSRGILMTRFQGTALEHFILPVVDPNSLIKSKA